MYLPKKTIQIKPWANIFKKKLKPMKTNKHVRAFKAQLDRNNMVKKLREKVKTTSKVNVKEMNKRIEKKTKKILTEMFKPKSKKVIKAWAVMHQMGRCPWYLGSVGMENHYIDTLTVFESEQEANDYIKESNEYRNWARNLKAKVVPVTITINTK